MSEENVDPLYGKPWKNFATCKTYEKASEELQQLMNTSQNIQTKIKRRANETFVVKVRSLEVNSGKDVKQKEKQSIFK